MLNEARELASLAPGPMPLSPMTDQEIARHQSLVQQRKRADVVIPDPLPPTSFERDDVILSHVILHRQCATFTIDELEATDAVEQFIEEFAVEQMTWKDAVETVAWARRSCYSTKSSIPTHDQSRSAMLRRDPHFSLHRRIADLFELGKMVAVTTLPNVEYDNSRMGTNETYWGCRDAKDYKRVYHQEMKYLLSVPDIAQRVYDMMPWLNERGWLLAPLAFLTTVRTHIPETKEFVDKVLSEPFPADALDDQSWSDARKPGVVVRHRPRAFLI